MARLSIGSKISLVTLASTCMALALAAVLFMGVDRKTSREQLATQIVTLAQALGTNCASALLFLDSDAAEDTLRAFEAEPAIQAAVVYDQSGTIFAEYRVEGANGLELPSAHEAVPGLLDDAMTGVSPIEVDGEPIGKLWVRASLRTLQERQSAVLATQGLAALLGLAAAMLIVAWMQRLISGPVRTLTALAGEVTEASDYTRRAPEQGHDEVGDLGRAFNRMLAIIERRNAQLARHRDQLEQKVAARTKDLEATNAQLKVSMEEAQAAAVAKSQFLANMSHEIRTPMNGVLGMATLLGNSTLDVRQRDMLDTVINCANDLLRIINDILDFSKIEAGKLELETVVFEVEPLFESAGELFYPLVVNKDLELSVFIDPRLPRRLVGDPGRIRQIVQNFMNNALKFTARGEIALRVTVVERREREVSLSIEVRDTGIGIPEDRRHRLFAEFSQVDASNSRKYGGTGLGLAISKRLAEAMGGRVECESVEGEGSTFRVVMTLPVAAEPTPVSHLPEKVFLGQPVVVLEDAETLRENLTCYLETWGCKVRSVSRADQALAALHRFSLETNRPPVLLLDWQSVGEDGLRIMHLARTSPGLERVRFVVLVPPQITMEGEVFEDHGEVSLVSKPLRVSHLFDCMATTLSRECVLLESIPSRSGSRGLPSPDGRVDARSDVEPNGTRVLVVEDNEVNQRVAVAFLQQAGYITAVACNGKQALERLERESFDVVLMDCQMPDMDGYATTQAIRRAECGTDRHQLVIALTAHALATDADRCYEAGMDDYVTKPVKPEALYGVLERWCGTEHQA